MSHLYISAAHKSSGKTTVSIGLCAALAEAGHKVQAFKKGPDYIDPLWLGRASGRACYNLDFYTTPDNEISDFFATHMQGADIGLIEGNKGLYDGMDVHGSDSNAAMARLLNAPVVLVINTTGVTRGVAPLLKGYQDFAPELDIAGVIFNVVGGARHEAKLINVTETYTDIQVIGSIWRDENLVIDERHLGLIPSNEQQQSEKLIESISEKVKQQVDLDKLLDIAASAPTPAESEKTVQTVNGEKLKVGIFQDEAFGFYYADDLEKFTGSGAELVKINALFDRQLPEVDALFIGGGFPETHMAELASNLPLLQEVKDYIENHGLVYAECGGLMYLCRSLTWENKHCKMVGVIPADVVMSDRPQGRGYIQLQETGNMPWPLLEAEDGIIRGHEFHYSRLENLADNVNFAYEVKRGHGITGTHDGFIYKNLLANYAHLRSVGSNDWVPRFIQFIRQNKSNPE